MFITFNPSFVYHVLEGYLSTFNCCYMHLPLDEFILAGRKVVLENAKYARSILLRHDSAESFLPLLKDLVPQQNIRIFSPKAFEKISPVKTSDGIMASFARLGPVDLSRLRSPVVFFDEIRDPGNIGTLMRVAAAFNFDVCLVSQCADIFSAKAASASMGACLHIRYAKIPNWISLPSSFDDQLLIAAEVNKESCTPRYANDMAFNGIHLHFSELPPDRLKAHITNRSFGLILGNESRGVSKGLALARRRLIARASIRMPNAQIDSLNVACAGSILMNALTF